MPSLETIQSQLLPKKTIRAATNRRLADSDRRTVPFSKVDELEGLGWVIEQEMATRVRMRRAKSHDRAFEDAVWAMMARLGFDRLNRDREMVIHLGEGKSEAQQIDVFAADDETVLIVECKSSLAQRPDTLKQPVEALLGLRGKLFGAIRKEFPNHKPKLVLAVRNIILSEERREAIERADIRVLDSEAVEYYLDLALHLGDAAKYQLLASLFAGQKIQNLDMRVPAIRTKMGGRFYYSFSIEPARLLKTAFVLHRSSHYSELLPTYQRIIKRNRLRKIERFVDSGGFFPNSLIINVDNKGKDLRFERLSQGDVGDSIAGVLHLPQTYRSAYIIDGQHRLYGYARAPRANRDFLPVVAFVNLPRPEQVQLFMQINENQQAVPKNLRDTLNADLLYDSDALGERVRALRLRVAQFLGENKSSPLFGRVMVGEAPRTKLRCISLDAVSNGIGRSGILGSFSGNQVKVPGPYYSGENDQMFKDLSGLYIEFFTYLRGALSAQWALGGREGGFVFRNSGIEALMRLLGDIVNHLVVSAALQPLVVGPTEVMQQARYYLDPAVQFFEEASEDRAQEFRKMYGSGAAMKLWRALQTEVRHARPEFDPEGLEDYLKGLEQQVTSEAYSMVQDIETHLKTEVRKGLEDEHGHRWFRKGVPFDVQQRSSQIAIAKNAKLRDDEEDVEEWDCLHIVDYQKILTFSHDVWERRFAGTFTAPGTEGRSWKTQSSWIDLFNTIRNAAAHDYSVSETDYEYLTWLTSWLINGEEAGPAPSSLG